MLCILKKSKWPYIASVIFRSSTVPPIIPVLFPRICRGFNAPAAGYFPKTHAMFVFITIPTQAVSLAWGVEYGSYIYIFCRGYTLILPFSFLWGLLSPSM